jgi:hypothetical protein
MQYHARKVPLQRELRGGEERLRAIARAAAAALAGANRTAAAAARTVAQAEADLRVV